MGSKRLLATLGLKEQFGTSGLPSKPAELGLKGLHAELYWGSIWLSGGLMGALSSWKKPSMNPGGSLPLTPQLRRQQELLEWTFPFPCPSAWDLVSLAEDSLCRRLHWPWDSSGPSRATAVGFP